MLKTHGIATREDVETKLPSDEKRRQQGPYAVFECYQEIPCNPCEKSCPRGAVTIGEDINEVPVVDYSICNGCSVCVSACPGLAIFIIHEDVEPGISQVLMPWEYAYVPERGDKVTALDRAGKPVCEAEVSVVRQAKRQDRTTIIGLKVPTEFIQEVRGFRGEEQK